MKNYVVRKTGKDADTGHVDTWPWNYSYSPETEFRVTHGDEKFHISLRSYEKDPVARISRQNGPVCNDSCMEFFFSTAEDCSTGYFNFEVNSNPTFLFDYHDPEGNEEHVDCTAEDLCIRTTYGKDGNGREYWQIDFDLGFDLIKKYVPGAGFTSGTVFRANVYKCGCTDQPDHYGSWNLVDTPAPDFHVPRCFGLFICE